MTNEVWSWRSAGIWMAALAGALQIFNAARAYLDPAGFASYFGLSLVDQGDAGLVHIYALRALFIGLLVTALIATRQARALTLLAITAVVMPVGDALLAANAGAPAATVVRHAAVAVYLVVTAWLLRRMASRSPGERQADRR